MIRSKKTATALPLLSLWLFACTSSPTTGSPVAGTVTDTLGKKFTVNCAGNLCALASQDPNVVPKSCVQSRGTDTFVLVLSNVLTIMALPVTNGVEYQLTASNPAHPVACVTDADCLAPGLALNVNGAPLSYTCANGLCRLPGQPLITNDVIALCQADLPWPTACPYLTEPKFAARLNEVAAVCGSSFTCAKIPADCAQPTALPDAGTAPTPDTGPPDAPAVGPIDAPAVGPIDAASIADASGGDTDGAL